MQFELMQSICIKDTVWTDKLTLFQELGNTLLMHEVNFDWDDVLPYWSLLASQTHRTDGFHGNHESKLNDQGPRTSPGGDCNPGAGEKWGIVTPLLRTSFSGLWPLERSKDLFLGIVIAALKRSRDLSQGLWPTLLGPVARRPISA